MSKSLKNIIDPAVLRVEHGVDPVRYFLLRDGLVDGDGDYSTESLEKRFYGDLADTLGNLGAWVLVCGRAGPRDAGHTRDHTIAMCSY